MMARLQNVVKKHIHAKSQHNGEADEFVEWFHDPPLMKGKRRVFPDKDNAQNCIVRNV
jgi:hypothetical protein